MATATTTRPLGPAASPTITPAWTVSAAPVDAAGAFHCADENLDEDGSIVHAFHDANRCVKPDLDHNWASSHREANFDHPNDRHHSPMSGFVRVNDETEQHDNGTESPTEDETMGFYNQDEIRTTTTSPASSRSAIGSSRRSPGPRSPTARSSWRRPRSAT